MMVVIYRGRHCPLCTKYLNAFESFRPQLAEIGIDLAAVSADRPEQLARHREQLVAGLRWIRDPKSDYPIRGTYLEAA